MYHNHAIPSISTKTTKFKRTAATTPPATPATTTAPTPVIYAYNKSIIDFYNHYRFIDGYRFVKHGLVAGNTALDCSGCTDLHLCVCLSGGAEAVDASYVENTSAFSTKQVIGYFWPVERLRKHSKTGPKKLTSLNHQGRVLKGVTLEEFAVGT